MNELLSTSSGSLANNELEVVWEQFFNTILTVEGESDYKSNENEYDNNVG